MVTSRWVWGLLGSAVILSGTGTATAQEHQQTPILLAQSTQKSGDELYAEGGEFYFLGTREGYEQAIELYKQALDAYKKEEDLSGQAITNDGIGISYDNLGYKQEALDYYQQTLAIDRAVGDRSGEAYTLTIIGDVYSSLGEKEKALAYYEEALPLRRAVGDVIGESHNLDLIGGVYSSLGEKEKALDYYERALTLWRAIDDHGGEAETLINIALMYDSLGEKEKALAYYQQTLPLFRAENHHGGEADTLIDIGLIYDDLGEKEKALDFYQQALPLYAEVGERGDIHGEATALLNIGVVYSSLGEKEKALAYFEQTLSIDRAVGNRSGEATTLNNIGAVYNDLGKKQQSLDFYQQALLLHRAVGDRSGEAYTLSNIGAVYDSLGEKEKALTYLEEALPIMREVGDRSDEATNLSNLANVYWALGEKEKALTYLEETLSTKREVGNRSGEATNLNNLARVYVDLGEKEKALTYLEEALPIMREVGDKDGEAFSLWGLGFTNNALGNTQEALNYYQQALPLFRAVGNRNGEAGLFASLGSLVRDEQPELAVIFYKQSVNIYETLRKDIEKLDSNIQQTYLSTIEGTYRRLADLLLQQNRVFEAQRVLDLLKVQELDKLFGDVRSGSNDDLGIFRLNPEADFLDRYNAKLREEIALGKEYIALQNRNNTTGLPPAEEKRFLELDQRQNSTYNRLTTFLNDPKIQALLTELKDYVDGNNQTFDPNEVSQLRAKFAAIQQRGKKAALLYPLILDDQLKLVLTTSLTSPIQRTVTISRTELNKLIAAAGQTLKDPSDTNYQALEELYQVLISPIEAALDEAGIETLVYAPDGALRYLPLAALRNPTTGKWLIDKYQINNVTALSLTNFGQEAPSNLNVLAGAFATGSYDLKVPVTNNQGTANRNFRFSGLTHAGEEVEAIARVTRTKPLLDNDFNQDITTRFNLYNVVHFATHAQFLPETPQDSFLVFGNGKYATLRDIDKNWGELTNNQLFVLSACETAVGTDFTELSETNSGIEILGLGYQLQNKGARAVLASLWQVQDDSTSILMTEFYQQLNGGVSTVEALQRAQQSLSQSTEYGHPHHWASFVLIGNGL